MSYNRWDSMGVVWEILRDKLTFVNDRHKIFKIRLDWNIKIIVL